MVKKREIIFFSALLLLSIIFACLFLLQRIDSNTTTAQTEQTPQLSTNSPEGVTKAYYNWYESCLKHHAQDLNNTAIIKDCPLHGQNEVANDFTQINQLTYTDKVLCDEGIPAKMYIGKAYIDATKTATVNVTTIFSDRRYAIPVRLHKENGTWKIFRIDCDLDGHIE
jgi:hypothetical protein